MSSPIATDATSIPPGVAVQSTDAVGSGQLARRFAQLGLQLGGVRDAREAARHVAEPAQGLRLVGAFALATGQLDVGGDRRGEHAQGLELVVRRRLRLLARRRTACRSAARRPSPASRHRSRGPWRCRRSAGRRRCRAPRTGRRPATACAQKESARGAWSPLLMPASGLRPLPVGVDEVERGDRRVQQARGERDQLVEGRVGRRLEQTGAAQSGETLGLGVGDRGDIHRPSGHRRDHAMRWSGSCSSLPAPSVLATIAKPCAS